MIQDAVSPELATEAPDPNTVLGDIPHFLGNRTPQTWVEMALDNLTVLLIDHAQCEKKAASAAMSMMYKYVDRRELLSKMSKLAREELVHFDQVLKLMDDRGIQYTHLTAGRYAGALHELIRKSEPEKLVDRLILGAFVEARSCERFAALVPELYRRGDDVLGRFYFSLLKSEARHYKDYLTLARLYSETDITDRIDAFREVEASLIALPDETFRFHSGVPAQG